MLVKMLLYVIYVAFSGSLALLLDLSTLQTFY